VSQENGKKNEKKQQTKKAEEGKEGEKQPESDVGSGSLQKRVAHKGKKKQMARMSQFMALSKEGKGTGEVSRAAAKEVSSFEEMLHFRQKCEQKCR